MERAHSANVTRFAGLSRRDRRLLVLATLVGFPGMYLWAWLMQGTSVSPLLWGPFAFVLLGLTIVAGTIIWIWTRNRTDLRNTSLDERERRMRDRVYVLSYQVLGVALGLILTPVAIFAAFGSVLTIDFGLMVPFIVGGSIYYPALPSLVLAWIDPDPLAEDE